MLKHCAIIREQNHSRESRFCFSTVVVIHDGIRVVDDDFNFLCLGFEKPSAQTIKDF
jgi:hypothetical protein